MLPLAALSLYSMHVSSQLVVLRSLNVQRAERVFHAMLYQLPPDARPAARTELTAPTPEQIAEVETFAQQYRSVFRTEMLLQPLIGGPPTGGWRLALPFARSVSSTVAFELLRASPAGACARDSDAWAATWHAGAAYAIAVHTPSARDAPEVLVWHSSTSTPLHKLQAVWHACVLRHALDGRRARPLDLGAAHARAMELWPAVLRSMESTDWLLGMVYLDGDGAYLEREDTAAPVRAPRADARAGDRELDE